MTSAPAWFDNDALFRRELEAGHRWAARVVDALCAEGLAAELSPLEWRNDIHDRHRFSNERDITVQTAAGPITIESKSRNLFFYGSPQSYPYHTALIDTVSGWDRKDPKPSAVVLISQKTEGMLVVSPRRTRRHWTIKSTRDRVRDIEDHWYEVHRDHLVPLSVLTDWLRSLG